MTENLCINMGSQRAPSQETWARSARNAGNRYNLLTFAMLTYARTATDVCDQ